MRFVLFSLLLLAAMQATAQDSLTGVFRTIDIGAELFGNNEGFSPGIRVEAAFNREYSISLKGGYTSFRKGHTGRHEDEAGEGYGFTVGYRHYFGKGVLRGIFLGAKTDCWFNTVRWKDGIGTTAEVNGVSKTTVIQPSMELGYNFLLAKQRLVITPLIAFSVETNVATSGKPVDGGPLLLLGTTLSYRLRW